MFSVITYLPLYFQDIRGDTPIISGLLFVCMFVSVYLLCSRAHCVLLTAHCTRAGLKQIPLVVGWQFSTINAGVYISRTGKYYWIPVAGSGTFPLCVFCLTFCAALAVAICGLLSLMDETMNYGPFPL